MVNALSWGTFSFFRSIFVRVLVTRFKVLQVVGWSEKYSREYR